MAILGGTRATCCNPGLVVFWPSASKNHLVGSASLDEEVQLQLERLEGIRDWPWQRPGLQLSILWFQLVPMSFKSARLRHPQRVYGIEEITFPQELGKLRSGRSLVNYVPTGFV